MYSFEITSLNNYTVCAMLAHVMLQCDIIEFNSVSIPDLIQRGMRSLVGGRLYSIPNSIYAVVTDVFEDIHAEGLTAGVQLMLCPNGLSTKDYKTVLTAIREDLRSKGVAWLITSRRVSPYKYLYEYKRV